MQCCCNNYRIRFSGVNVFERNDGTARYLKVWSHEYGTLIKKIYSLVFVTIWFCEFLEGTSMCNLNTIKNKQHGHSTRRIKHILCICNTSQIHDYSLFNLFQSNNLIVFFEDTWQNCILTCTCIMFLKRFAFWFRNVPLHITKELTYKGDKYGFSGEKNHF